MAASALPNTPLTTLEWVRRTAGMSRPDLAELSGVSGDDLGLLAV